MAHDPNPHSPSSQDYFGLRDAALRRGRRLRSEAFRHGVELVRTRVGRRLRR